MIIHLLLRMDALSIIVTSEFTIFCFIILVGSILLIGSRDRGFVRISLPIFTLINNYCYIILAAFFYFQFLKGFINCISSLWVPFISMILISSSYIVKILHLFFILIHTSVKLRTINEVEHKGCTHRIELVIYSSTKRNQIYAIWKIFFTLILIQLILPISLQIFDERFKSKDNICYGRSYLEIELFSSLLVIDVVIYVLGLLFLIKYKDTYGIKQQLFGIAFSWFIILIAGILFNLFQTKIYVKYFYIVFIPIYILPFFFETLYPVIKKKRAEIISNKLKPSDLSINEIKYYILHGDSDLIDYLLDYIVHLESVGYDCKGISNCVLLLKDSLKKGIISAEHFNLPFRQRKKGLTNSESVYKSSSYRSLRKSQEDIIVKKNIESSNSFIFLCMDRYFNKDGFLYIPVETLTPLINQCIDRISDHLKESNKSASIKLHSEKIHNEFITLLRAIYDSVIWKFIIETKTTDEFESFKYKILQKSLDIGITNEISIV